MPKQLLKTKGKAVAHIFGQITAALFTIARIWKQTKCPLTNEWLKMWYIYGTIGHKKEQIGSYVVMWMKLEPMIQSEVSQKEKNSIIY